ncbi:FAD binding domain-containing protein [Streptomyces sp. NPDC048269]|uniref:FAD binding domain-containing protein n=1 Tax=Streptomyces sp. NPDC048269 TaxID=3155753 RepID=UPI00341D4ABD
MSAVDLLGSARWAEGLDARVQHPDAAPIAAGAAASRTVGSPPSRGRGTVGGNLATASPADDRNPSLVSPDAQIGVASLHSSRMIPPGAPFTGVKHNAPAEGNGSAAPTPRRADSQTVEVS